MFPCRAACCFLFLLMGIMFFMMTIMEGTHAQDSGSAVIEVFPLFEQAKEFQPRNRIDELLLASLAKKDKDIIPAPLCSDAVFVRRIYLDLTGTLPMPAEVRAFLDVPVSGKRNALIDKLLDRPEFVDYWTMQWCDLLRVKAEFPINLWPNGALCYYNWIRDAVRVNKPYNRFAYELLTADGSNFRDGAANFYRAVPEKNAETLAEAVAQTFLGTRVVYWPEEKRADLALFFSRVAYKETAEWKEEIVYWNRRPLEINTAVFPDGRRIQIPPNTDPRYLFADWLTAPENTGFSRCIANRVWFWLFGQGLVHEPDDFRNDNPPIHPELLDYLAADLVRSGYDLKHLFRLITRSATYQQSSIARGDAEIAQEFFAVYPVRRLEAEVLQDAVATIFNNTLGFNSEVPEPFTYVPPRYRTIVLPDASITNPFLEMFGRPTRDTGLISDRNNSVTESQQLFLLNSTEINNWVRRLGQGNRWRTREGIQAAKVIEDLWLLILSRRPSPDEHRIATAHLEQNGRLNDQKIQDLVWALLNSKEFLCRH